MTSIVQLQDPQRNRRVAMVQGNALQLLHSFESAYALAAGAARRRQSLVELTRSSLCGDSLDYNDIYEGRSAWALLPAFDHPNEPARCLVSGTGLTHKASALNRQAMHAQTAGDAPAPPLTDSMKIFQWGLEGGRPADGQPGVQPEWFYKGNGLVLRSHGQPLEVPAFADDGGDEGEIAGIYLIDDQGQVRRVGFAVGNEFSDHVMEKKNYLYLAPSKLRTCALGPELHLDASFDDVQGHAQVERDGQIVWQSAIATGQRHMSHSLANLEHHQFKYAAHRRPGDAHVHFFGAAAFSFGQGIALADGDVMSVEFSGFGRPLRNPIRIDRSGLELVQVQPL